MVTRSSSQVAGLGLCPLGCRTWVRPSQTRVADSRGVRIEQAQDSDVAALARLLWLDTVGEEPEPRALDEFAAELARWWAERQGSHVAIVARYAGPGPSPGPGVEQAQDAGPRVVGMAWVALLPRVPRPGATRRLSADVQSVFVLPGHRGHGIGSALVEAATRHATGLGAGHVTVRSGRRAVPVYERLGFVSSPRLLERSPG